MFDKSTISAIQKIAGRMHVEPAALQAVAEVESNGVVFASVHGHNEPIIRFEGHYFDRLVPVGKRALARKEGLASPIAGAIKNPVSQAGRWALVNRAAAIDHQAAWESVSWGLGQVMGANWRKLGFGSVDELVALARSGAAGQIDLMARYIERFDLVDELQRKDFAGFKRGYNGPAANNYAEKMRAAYARITGGAAVTSSGMLHMGSKGAGVRELQTLLIRAGHAIKVDGDFGPATKTALKAFQKAAGIAVDGIAGPQTMRALNAYRQSATEVPGKAAIMDLPQTRAGTIAAGSGIGFATAADKLSDIADRLGQAGGWASHLSVILYAVAGVLVIAGLGWAVYGWLESRKTHEAV